MTDQPAGGGGVVEWAGDRVNRVESVDVARGVVMVLMVLDHVRDFLTDPQVDPTNLATTTPALFFTRWVTHFCAPTFFVLAGVGAALSGARRTRAGLSRHLLTRGLGLLVLSQTWENVFLFFTYPHVVLALVLWGIGWSMIALAGLVFLPRPVIGAIGLALIASHNLADGLRVQNPNAAWVWALLHERGFNTLPGGIPVLIGYPLIPWVGVMASGYAIGPLFFAPPPRRRTILFAIGFVSILAFVAIRASHVYGDPRPWSVQATPLRTLMSFLNCEKYPPSLLYLLMTLGSLFLGLALLDRPLGRWAGPFRAFGQVPLFFYLLQWPVAHGLAVAVELAQGHPVGWMFRFPPFPSPSGFGQSLPTVYLLWAVAVALLWYPCLAYRWARSRRGFSRLQPSPLPTPQPAGGPDPDRSGGASSP